jgi:hypothetical protein
MKPIRLVLLSFLSLTLISCGNSSSPAGINGGWFAQLNNVSGSSELGFSVTLAQGSGATVNSSSLTITSPSPCFPQATVQAATFTASGSSSGYLTGPFTMTISTIFPTGSNNVITMQGNRNGSGIGSITGTWTLTGYPGCSSGNGTFTMNPPQAGG